MGDAHALGEFAGLAAESLLGEETDRLIDNEALALRRAHVAPAGFHGGFGRFLRQVQRLGDSIPDGAPSYRNLNL
jgi:hypothetical protein